MTTLAIEIADYASTIIENFEHSLDAAECLEQVELHIASQYPEAPWSVVGLVLEDARNYLYEPDYSHVGQSPHYGSP